MEESCSSDPAYCLQYTTESDIRKDKEVPVDHYPEHPNFDVKATHLFELSSVTIVRPDTLEEIDDIALYGRIHLVDDNDDEFAVFCHERKDAQFISFQGSSLKLSLRHSKLNRPHLLPKLFWIKLYLKDMSRDVKIVKGKFKLDFTGNILFNTEQCASFDTLSYGVISFHYTIHELAVLAMVECKFGRNDGPQSLRRSRPPPYVKGIISAQVDSKLGKDDGFSHLLFDIDSIVPSTFAPPDEQSWTSPWFAVPAYSSLRIRANLEIDDEKIEDFVKFKARYRQVCELEHIMPGKKWHVVVKVSWEHAFSFLPMSDLPGTERDELIGQKNLYFSDIDDYSQSQEDVTTDVPYSFLDSAIDKKAWLYSYPGNHVEVFSIIVCHFADDTDGYDDHDLKKKKRDKTSSHMLLSGVIRSRDSLGDYEIFKRDRTCPALIESRGALSILHPSHCYRGPNFGIIFDLQDSQGHQISKGFINMDDFHVKPWYDKRVCSVVPGDFGFAAVHYTCFERAVQANVGVYFKCSGQPFTCQVYGRIYARYGCYRYLTRYEKENYQSILFEKLKVEESVELNDNENVPLFKDTVGVPSDESLVIVADLRLCVSGMDGEHILRGKTTFWPGCNVGREIYGTSCALAYLGVCVKWGIF